MLLLEMHYLISFLLTYIHVPTSLPWTHGVCVSGSSLKYISLVVLTLQNAVLILVMRYVRVRKGDMFIASTAVVMTELLKFIASLTFIFLEQGACLCWVSDVDILWQNYWGDPLVCGVLGTVVCCSGTRQDTYKTNIALHMLVDVIGRL